MLPVVGTQEGDWKPGKFLVALGFSLSQRSDVYVTNVCVTDIQTVSQEIEQARTSSARH